MSERMLPDLKSRIRIDTSDFHEAKARANEFRESLIHIGEVIGVVFAVDKIKDWFAEGFKDIEALSALQEQTAAAIKSTGDASKVSADHIRDQALALQEQTGVSKQAIQTGENILLTFTSVQNGIGKGKDIYDQATKSVLDLSTAMHEDMQSAAVQVGKALSDPVKGITALHRIGVTFTEQQKKQIAAMVKSGDTMGAQRVILAELNKEFGGSADAFGNSLPGQIAKTKNAFDEVREQLITALLPGLTKVMQFVVERVLPDFQRLTDWITGDLMPKIQGIGSVVQPAFAEVADVAAAVWPTVRGLIESAVAGVAEIVVKLSELFHRVWPAMSVVITKAATTIQAIWKAVWPDIRNIFQTSFDIISRLIGVAIGAWSFVWKYFGDYMVSEISLAFNIVSDVVTTVVHALSDIFSAIADILGGKWGDAWGKIVDLFKTIFGGLWKIAKDIITGLPGVLWNAIVGIAKALGDVGGNIINSVKGGIAGAVAGLWAWVTGLPDGLWNAIVGIWDRLIGIGGQIIQGIINGVRAHSMDLVNAVSAIIPGGNLAAGYLNTQLAQANASQGTGPGTAPWGGAGVKSHAGGGWLGTSPHLYRGGDNPKGEGVFTADQLQAMAKLGISLGGQGGGRAINIYVTQTNPTPHEIAREVAWAL